VKQFPGLLNLIGQENNIISKVEVTKTDFLASPASFLDQDEIKL